MGPLAAGLITAAVQGGSSMGTSALGAIAGSKSVSGKAYKKQIERDVAALEKGEFGMTAAQKQEAMKSAVRAAQGTSAEQTAALQAQQAAMGGVRSGQMAGQMAGLGQQASTGAALASADIEKTSQALAAQQREAALARIRAHRDKVQRDWSLAGAGAQEGLEAGGQAAYSQYASNLDTGVGAAATGGVPVGGE